MQHCYHLLSENRVALWCHKVESHLEFLLFTDVWDLDLYLYVHEPSALHHFLELVLAVGSVRKTVVTSNHSRCVPRNLCQVANFKLKRGPTACLSLFVELVSRVPIILKRKRLNDGELTHHLFS